MLWPALGFSLLVHVAVLAFNFGSQNDAVTAQAKTVSGQSVTVNFGLKPATTNADRPADLQGATKVSELDLSILTALSRFAFLRTADLIAYLPAYSDPAIRRAVSALKSLDYIAHTVDADRNHVLALSVKGANATRLQGFTAHSTTKFLNGGNYEHRLIANQAIIYHSQDVNNSTWTEHQIQAGQHPLKYSFNKMPDYLVRHDELGFVWGEVERTKKSKTDFSHFLSWLSLMFTAPAGELPQLTETDYLFRVEIACTPSFERRLLGVVGEDFADNWLLFRPLDVAQWS